MRYLIPLPVRVTTLSFYCDIAPVTQKSTVNLDTSSVYPKHISVCTCVCIHTHKMHTEDLELALPILVII